MSDLISRQAAIDAVTRYCTRYDLRELLADIEAIPAQKEITQTQVAEYCGKGGLVVITVDTFDDIIAYYNRRNGMEPYKGEQNE